MPKPDAKLKVMVIDADVFMATILCRKFKDCGFVAEPLNDDRKVVNAVIGFRPDVIVCELFIGRLSGYDILNKLKTAVKVKKPLHFIFLTRSAAPDEHFRAVSAGADAFLLKTELTFDDIVSVIRRVADGQQADPGVSDYWSRHSGGLMNS